MEELMYIAFVIACTAIGLAAIHTMVTYPKAKKKKIRKVVKK